MFVLPDDTNLADFLVQFPGLLYIKDLRGRYIGYNHQLESFLQTHGFHNSQSLGPIYNLTDFDLFEENEAKKLVDNDRSVLLTGERGLFEEVVTDAKGIAHTHISNKQPLRDKEGEIIAIICTSIDIDQQINEFKQQQKTMIQFDQVKQKNTYMDSILWHLPEQFFWMDLDSRLVACNEQQTKFFGIPIEELLGTDIADVAKRTGILPETVDKVLKHDRQVIETRQPLMVEEVAEIKGKMHTALSYKYPLFDQNDEVIGVFGVSIDITERKRLEGFLNEQKRKAEIASQIKTDFLMNISHDIRTPFSSIIGNAELLIREETDNEKKQKLQQVINSSVSLLSLLNDIIDVVQFEDQNLNSQQSPMSLSVSINKIMTIMSIEAEQKKLELQVKIDENVPDLIISQSKTIDRILLNLLGNAIKFTDEGQVCIKLSSAPVNKDQVQITLRVEDSGIGIPDDKKDHIFEQFTRLIPATKRRYEGSGLGLWIVKQLVAQLNGTIEVQSQLGVGTTFIVRFTANLMVEPNIVKNKLEQVDTECINRRVLIVEDDPIAGKVAQSVIQDFFKVDVDIANCGGQALTLSFEQAYDFIIMDVGLPDMDGIEVSKIIKERSGVNENTPIIGLTAHAGLRKQNTAMNVIFEKPLTYELCEKISQNLISH